MSRCFEYIDAPGTPFAVKAFSLTVLQGPQDIENGLACFASLELILYLL